MLSKKAQYGLRALLALARESYQNPMLISDLAQHEGIPRKFLESILRELKNQGILQSRKGKGGGYFLGKSSQAITVGQVIRILDGPLAPLPCVSQTAYRKCDDCENETTCGVRIVMKEVRDETARILDGTTLADVLVRVENMSQKENLALLAYP